MHDPWLNAIASQTELATKGEIILIVNSLSDLEQGGGGYIPISIVPDPQFADDEDDE